MAKADTQSTATTSGDSSSPHDQKNLIEALTAAIIASRRDTQEPSPETKAAAKQYGDIKRALGTHAEPFPTQNRSRTRKA
jgi:hypothetical protein